MKGRLTQLHIRPMSNGGSEDMVQTQCGKDKLSALSCERTCYAENPLVKDREDFCFSSCVFHRMIMDHLNSIAIHSSSPSEN